MTRTWPAVLGLCLLGGCAESAPGLDPGLDAAVSEATCELPEDCSPGELCVAGECVLQPRPEGEGAEGEGEGAEGEGEGAEGEGEGAEGEGEGAEGEGEGASPACEPDGLEPDDLPSSAILLDRELLRGLSLCEGDEDWFLITLPQGAGLRATVSGGRPRVELRTADGRTLLGTGAAREDGVELLLDEAPTDGRYALRIWGLVLLSYDLRLEVRPPAPVSCDPDRLEPNDSPATARPFGGFAAAGLSLCDADEDWLQVELQRGEGLIAAVTGEGLQVELWDGRGAALQAGSVATGPGAAATLVAAPADGPYLVRVFGAVTPHYDLQLTLSPPASEGEGEGEGLGEGEGEGEGLGEGEGEGEGLGEGEGEGADPDPGCVNDRFERNDTPATATPLAGDFAGDLMICAADADYFRIPLLAGAELTADIDFDLFRDLDLYLEDARGNLLASSDSIVWPWESLSYTASRAEEVFLLVTGAWANTRSGYLLTVGVFGGTPVEDACRDPLEPNDDQDHASPLEAGQHDLGICAGDEDWFSVPLAASGSLAVTLVPAGSGYDLDLALLDASGRELASSRRAAGASEQIDFVATDAQSLSLRVFGYRPDDEGRYTLEVQY